MGNMLPYKLHQTLAPCITIIRGTFSLVLLAVVDAIFFFRVVDVGGYGRTSDSGRNSAFGEGIRHGTLGIPPDGAISGAEQWGPLPYVFVGDEASC